MAFTSKQGKDNKVSHKAVLKWKNQFNTKFDYELEGKDVVRLHCTFCAKWERRICSIKNFTYNYIRPGFTSIKKGSIKTHCLSEPRNAFSNMCFFISTPVSENSYKCI